MTIRGRYTSAKLDHGTLTGLTDDDHEQYLLADGTRALAGNWSLGNYNLTNGGTITAANLNCTDFDSSGAMTADQLTIVGTLVPLTLLLFYL